MPRPVHGEKRQSIRIGPGENDIVAATLAVERRSVEVEDPATLVPWREFPVGDMRLPTCCIETTHEAPRLIVAMAARLVVRSPQWARGVRGAAASPESAQLRAFRIWPDVWSDTDRYTVHDVHFSRFHGEGTNVDLGNSSIMMLTRNDDGRNHVAVVNNVLSGDNGILTSCYQLRHSVFEKNRGVGADFRVADGSVWSLIYIKSGNNEHVTLRANEFWDDNEWTNGKSALGVLRARNIELAYNTIHTPYDSGRTGALTLWTNSSLSDYSWTEDTPVWLYRNSLARRISYEGNSLANMPDGTVITERNVLGEENWPESDRIVEDENLDGEDYFGDDMRLRESYRDDYLGRYGAEIAVPADDASG